MLYYTHSGKGRPLIIIHGLFGSSANWRAIAKTLSSEYHVILPDLRNHGKSFHDQSMTYLDMAEDIRNLINKLGLVDTIVMGHSMGGKVAMTLALMNQDMASGYIFADIAPVNYEHDFSLLIESMQALNLDELSSRSEAEEQLLINVRKSGLVKFICQNIIRTDNGFRWRINLPSIKSNIADVLAFPVELKRKQSHLPSLFIGGAESPYMKECYNKAIFQYFPASEIVMLEDAGHWLHSDKPEQFTRTVSDFIRYI